MPTHSQNLGQCTFVGHKGTCGRKCFREVCSIHFGKKSMALCKNCGKRGTSTTHGFCQALETGCRWKSQYGSRVLKPDRDEMDDFINEVLSWPWETYVHVVKPLSLARGTRRNEVEGVMKRVVDAFVDRMVGGACLIASAALIHLLGRGDMIQGYLGRGGRFFCRHYWVRLDDVDYDVGSAIMAILAPHMKQLGSPELHHDRPSGTQMDDPGSLATLEHGYRVYQRDPSALLSGAPDWMHAAFNFSPPKNLPLHYSEDAKQQQGRLPGRLGVSKRSSRNNKRGHQI